MDSGTQRKQFVFYRSFWESIKDLPRDIQGEVLTAIVEYGLNGETTENPKPIAGAILTLIKPVIDANNKRFENGKLGGEHGNKGGRPKKSITGETYTKPQENPKETPKKPLKNPKETPNKDKDKDIDIINNINTNNKPKDLLFIQIKNLNEELKNFKGNKIYLFLAYKFWETWQKKNPNDQTYQKASAYKWADEVRKIIELDKVSTKRLIGIYSYFLECSEEKTEFDPFWFNTIKSITALRKKDNGGVFYIDKIADKVNEQLNKNEAFKELVNDKILKFEQYESLKAPKK